MIGGHLIEDSEPPAVTVLNGTSPNRFFFTCDHACNRVPAKLDGMGATPEQLLSHIAWDPGALPVARGLASRFQAPLVHGGYSRLVVDLNRPPHSPDSMPASSAGIAVPANLSLSEEERKQRLDALFHPYHQTIDSLLAERRCAGTPTILVAIHSFTPDYPGQIRPWHIGVIHRRDGGLGSALVEALRPDGDMLVGDNQPFEIQDDGDVTIPRHGEAWGLPNVLIELRQDTLATEAQRSRWVDRLHAALQRAADALPPPLS